ncbi:MAG: response regulator [Candidatus Omnitrophica bacterium]|nr:response regulator [Candidatus Omnitrophota bacterium]
MAKRKILIIDDEEVFAQMVKLNLEDTGQYQVRVETKGSQALATAQEFGPDLIFLDVIMPDVDGGEVAYWIERDEKLKSVPIVFLTAVVRKQEETIQDGIIAGHPHPFIAKPVGVKELLDCINRCIE